MKKHHSSLGGMALTLILVLTGCDSGKSHPNAQETRSETPSPTPTIASPTRETPEETAAAQLTKYLELRDTAYREVEINFKRLNQVATGREFLNVQQNVSAIEQSGSKVAGEYVHTLSEPRDRGTHILIIDCEDRSGVERTKNGKPVPEPSGPNGEPVPNPLPVEYTLIKQKGRWLVSDQNGLLGESC